MGRVPTHGDIGVNASEATPKLNLGGLKNERENASESPAGRA
jgi:hypothetical protein